MQNTLLSGPCWDFGTFLNKLESTYRLCPDCVLSVEPDWMSTMMKLNVTLPSCFWVGADFSRHRLWYSWNRPSWKTRMNFIPSCALSAEPLLYKTLVCHGKNGVHPQLLIEESQLKSSNTCPVLSYIAYSNMCQCLGTQDISVSTQKTALRRIQHWIKNTCREEKKILKKILLGLQKSEELATGILSRVHIKPKRLWAPRLSSAQWWVGAFIFLMTWNTYQELKMS